MIMSHTCTCSHLVIDLCVGWRYAISDLISFYVLTKICIRPTCVFTRLGGMSPTHYYLFLVSAVETHMHNIRNIQKSRLETSAHNTTINPNPPPGPIKSRVASSRTPERFASSMIGNIVNPTQFAVLRRHSHPPYYPF